MLFATRVRRLVIAVAGALTLAAAPQAPVQAEAQQALAVLLRQLQAKPLGLYDGMRFFRLSQPGGGSLTLTVSCEREQWRVQSSDNPRGGSSFYDTPFLSAKGIAHSWVCSTPAKTMQ